MAACEASVSRINLVFFGIIGLFGLIDHFQHAERLPLINDGNCHERTGGELRSLVGTFKVTSFRWHIRDDNRTAVLEDPASHAGLQGNL